MDLNSDISSYGMLKNSNLASIQANKVRLLRRPAIGGTPRNDIKDIFSGLLC
jgi:hypothetical protein